MKRHSPTRRDLLAFAAIPLIAQDRTALPASDDAFLEDLSRRAFLYFWERSSPQTGLVLDRALNSDKSDPRKVSSCAATGFGLTALCIAANRGWKSRAEALQRALSIVRFYAEQSPVKQGWFYHFVDLDTGARLWNCEISSIDTALLLAGVLTTSQYFADAELTRHANAIYARIDWHWMLNGHPNLLSMGWKPESGFLSARWDTYCELMILYLLGLGSPTTPLPRSSWQAWRRPRVAYYARTYISGAPTLFTHQYAHAWADFRGKRERNGTGIDWFENSVAATLAHKLFCLDLGKKDFRGCYELDQWGITASDSAKGYVAWGGPPRTGPIDGSVVPCAAGGSLMFALRPCIETLRTIQQRFGARVWNRYGMADAFHPLNGWTDPDVLGIDLGITLLSAENARTGLVWEWFMRNPEIQKAFRMAGLASPA